MTGVAIVGRMPSRALPAAKVYAQLRVGLARLSSLTDRATTPMQIISIDAELAALTELVTRAGLGVPAYNDVLAERMRAKRKGGELLGPPPGSGGDQKSSSIVELDYPKALNKTERHRWRLLRWAIPQVAWDAYFEQVRAGELAGVTVQQNRLLAIARGSQQRIQPAETIDAAFVELHHAEVGPFLDSLQAHPVDAIITDPPYGTEYIPLYETLAKGAPAALVEGGCLAVMCGQWTLPTVLPLMAQYLPYRWTLAYLTPGGQSPQIWPVKVNTFWKPVLLFGGAPDWIGDVIRSDVNDNDKRFHIWGQGEAGTARLVELLTEPGQRIADPFVGGGTMAAVGARLGRYVIGADSDAEAIRTTKARCGA